MIAVVDWATGELCQQLLAMLPAHWASGIRGQSLFNLNTIEAAALREISRRRFADVAGKDERLHFLRDATIRSRHSYIVGDLRCKPLTSDTKKITFIDS